MIGNQMQNAELAEGRLWAVDRGLRTGKRRTKNEKPGTDYRLLNTEH